MMRAWMPETLGSSSLWVAPDERPMVTLGPSASARTRPVCVPPIIISTPRVRSGGGIRDSTSVDGERELGLWESTAIEPPRIGLLGGIVKRRGGQSPEAKLLTLFGRASRGTS